MVLHGSLFVSMREEFVALDRYPAPLVVGPREVARLESAGDGQLRVWARPLASGPVIPT